MLGLKEFQVSKTFKKDFYDFTWNIDIFIVDLCINKFMRKIQVSDQEIMNLLIEGYSCPKIAEKLHVDKQIIQRRVKLLDIPTNIYIKHRGKILYEDLTYVELNTLIGTILGDAWVGRTKKAKNSSGSFTHKMEHKEYVEYKYDLLKRLCSEPKIHYKKDNRSNRVYQQYFCKIATNPAINTLRDMFYINNVKVVHKDVVELGPLGLAIWFMDDGSKTPDGYKFATDCFSEGDKDTLIKLLKNYNLVCTKQKVSKCIYIKKESVELFTLLIKEFVPNCMKYKLHSLKELV